MDGCGGKTRKEKTIKKWRERRQAAAREWGSQPIFSARNTCSV